MTPETLEALKASIAKWERNAVAETADDIVIGPRDCPLCEAFNKPKKRCAGCPVAEKAGQPYCDGTPYSSVQFAKFNWFSRGTISAKKKAIAAVQAEVAFLKSLLPPEEQVP